MNEMFGMNIDPTEMMGDAPSQGKAPEARSAASGRNLDLLMDVMLQVVVELGRTRMPLRQVLELQQGSVVELDRLAGEAVDVYVNERLIARGEVVVVDDKFGVRITELISTKGAGES
jgi:flagellar motor switch protein FliN